MKVEIPYNPLDKKNLGVSVAEAMLQRPVETLPPKEIFIGAGIYAIYYVGSHPLYEPLVERNRGGRFVAPIYVGKAVPEGSRKGGLGLDVDPGTALHKRLKEHVSSILQASNLEISDFHYRHLTVDDIWIPLGESLLIEMFSPVWNKALDGFGNHAPGGGRDKQKRSPWDTLHPGRSWAETLPPNEKSAEELTLVVRYFLTTHSG